MPKNEKRALVTGGAGLIGSHLTDLLVREGWKVRVLDNLEPNTHKRGKPSWINPQAEFIEGCGFQHFALSTVLHRRNAGILQKRF